MYCTISRLREAVSFNQVPYPAGTVSASSFCRRPPPWSRLLLALAPGSNLTLPHSPGAPPLQEGESAGEWQASSGEYSGWAPQTHNQGHFCRSHAQWRHIGPTEGKTHLTWEKLLSVAMARLLLFKGFHNFKTKTFLLCDRSTRKRLESLRLSAAWADTILISLHVSRFFNLTCKFIACYEHLKCYSPIKIDC